MSKKWKAINLTLFIIAILVSYYYFPIQFCKNLDANNISYIKVNDLNNNKTFLIKNNNDISYIIKNINNRIYKKNGFHLTLKKKGITLTFNNGKENVETINLYSETIIKKYPFLYYSPIENDQFLYSYLLNIENEFDLFRDYTFLLIDKIKYKENKINYIIDDLNQIKDLLLFLSMQKYEQVEKNIDLSTFKTISIQTGSDIYPLKINKNYIFFNNKLYYFETNIEEQIIQIIKEDNWINTNSILNLQMRVNCVSKEKLNFIIYNNNLNDCFFESSNYIIEKYNKDNNSWIECDIKKDKLYQTFVRFNEDKISYIWEFNKKYENLDEGIYRLSFDVLNIDKTKKEPYLIYFRLKTIED